MSSTKSQSMWCVRPTITSLLVGLLLLFSITLLGLGDSTRSVARTVSQAFTSETATKVSEDEDLSTDLPHHHHERPSIHENQSHSTSSGAPNRRSQPRRPEFDPRRNPYRSPRVDSTRNNRNRQIPLGYRGGRFQNGKRPSTQSSGLLVGDGNTTQCDTLSVFMKENPNCSNKKPLIQLLSQASVCLKPEYCTMLPSWHEVVDLYGNKPIVLGTEICATYQKLIRGHDPMPKIAGLWNTGTTALSKTFLHNMELYRRNWSIDRATVPWGKHTPLYLKYNNTYPPRNPDNKDLVLPIVVVRDPFTWMSSMCRHPYGAKWKRGSRCPNLIPTSAERVELGLGEDDQTFEVDHTNFQARFRFHTPYESLAQMWSSWNADYLDASFPRLIIRMEDMIFFPEQVIRIIGNCSGMPIQEDFDFLVKQGKDASDTNLVTAMIKYGKGDGRIPMNLTQDERKYLRTVLDPTLMQRLHYVQILVK